MWDIIGSKELFQKVHDQNGHYDAKLHLAEMIALLGPPPRILLEKSKAMAKHHWPYPVRNDTGELCNSAEEFFHGPFFNAEGELTAAISMSISNILTFFFFEMNSDIVNSSLH